MNASFRKYAETLEKIEVLTVTITPEGEYNVPSEKKGKIAQIDDCERVRLRHYLFEFACRMECEKLDPEELADLRRMLAEFSNSLECPNPEHASEPKKVQRRA